MRSKQTHPRSELVPAMDRTLLLSVGELVEWVAATPEGTAAAITKPPPPGSFAMRTGFADQVADFNNRGGQQGCPRCPPPECFQETNHPSLRPAGH
jgi:hypothetical protein